MAKSVLNYESPKDKEKRLIEEERKLTPQQRFDRLMVLIELSYLLKNAKKVN
jgi:hypothetical protein